VLGRAGNLASYSLMTLNALSFCIRSFNHLGTPPLI
jgi:hypothetical protein